MSTINYTYNVIVDRFRQFAEGHFQLRRFTHGEISQADLEKEAEWPWLHVKPRAINYSPGTRSFSFEIFISDLPRDKEDKTGYQAESITDCSLIFQDLINEIYLGNMFGSDVVLTRPVNAEPFVEQYTHTLTGVTGTIELNLDYDWSACSIPASWNYNTPTDSPSDGWGALQFIESLDQNGVFVSLDGDVEAPGNGYYYGTNASGVKGWYQLIDNVGITCEDLPECATIISIEDDIAALQTDVALKANSADLGATAFSNSYNDLDDKPSIPSIAGLATVTYVDQQDALKVDKVAGKGLSTEDYTTAEKTKLAGIQDGAEVNVNADWNAVSGDAQILNKPTIPSIAGLVPETRTLTINGTTQDLSANRTFTIATGLTVGTTPITSGAVGRVLFEGTGNVLQQSGSLFWDNTNSRLGIGTASPTTVLDVNGTTRLNGLTSINGIGVANTALAVYGNGNGGGNYLFRMYDASAVERFYLTASGNFRLNGATDTSTTGTDEKWRMVLNFAPTSGTRQHNGIYLTQTINQTGGANGITRGLYINPTLTAAADFRAIETTAGNVLLGASGNTRLGVGTNTFWGTTTALIVGNDGAGSDSRLGVANTSKAGVYLGLIAYKSQIFAFDYNTATSMPLFLNSFGGNVAIGTTTDAGYKLDVNGTARVVGVLYATGNYIQYGTNLNVGIGSTNNGNSFANNGPAFLYATANINTTAIYGHNYFTGAYNATSGIQGSVNFVGATFNPTSGTAVFNTMNLTATINQTGGASGITRGLYVNPTLTAAANFRAIETARGNVVFGNLPTSSAGLPTGAIWNDAGTLKIV